jgi:hypothetical protein
MNMTISARAFGVLAKASSFVVIAVQMTVMSSASAAGLVQARDSARTISLADFKGKTYLQATLEAGDGINAKTAADDAAAVTIADAAQVVTDINTYDSKVANEIFPYFTGRQAGFQSAAAKLQGQSIAPPAIQSALAPITGLISPTTASHVAVVGSDLMLLSSGSGIVVELNPESYFYNIGYQSPLTQSGRTFVVAPGRLLLDPSDNDYLGETSSYLISSSPQEASNFYTAMFTVLTSCDASGVSSLDPDGQIVLTDLLGIYTAESIRHNMVNLNPTNAAWEIDVAEVTMVGAYVAASGMVMDGGKLTNGTLSAYYNGHSIGTHEADFIKLATLITAYENAGSHHKAMITSLTKLTPIKSKVIAKAVKGDIFRRVLMYLNRTEFASDAQSHAAEITAAVAQLIDQIRTDQDAITQYVTAHE